MLLLAYVLNQIDYFYNIMNMNTGSQIMPIFLVFHPMASPNIQISYQQAFPQPSYAVWTHQHPTMTSSSQLKWPEKVQNLPGTFQSSESGQQPHVVIVKELTRRIYHRIKNQRQRNSKKELESAKKNSESNIINQLYSFFNSYEKSENVVQRAIKLLNKEAVQVERIKSIFYNIIRLINYKRGRNYVNRQSILSYYTPQRFVKKIPQIQQKLDQVQLLTLEELCVLFRTATAYFIRNISISAILTSKRITTVAKNQHFKRRRKILTCLKEKMID